MILLYSIANVFLLIGYKLRKHISKAITRRSATIRTALAAYNQLAPLQNPARPVLQFSEIASYAFLGDFELLKHSRHDVVAKPWASASNREVATRYFKVRRAHEEINRLNREINRLSVWVDHEDTELLDAARRLEDSQPELAAEVHAFRLKRKRINDVHRTRLDRIYKLEGYSGNVSPRKSTNGVESTGDIDGREPIGADEDDELGDEMVRLTECLDNIS
jgi:hypothetical protein